jgi:hypothetical protein
MIERRCGARFPLEARNAIAIVRQSFRKDLERDLPAKARVACPEDLAHAPGTEKGDDFVDAEPLAG